MTRRRLDRRVSNSVSQARIIWERTRFCAPHGPGKTEVLFLDAEQALRLIGNPALEPIAKEASERLHRAASMLVGDRIQPEP